MRLVCPNCEAKYEVPEDAIPETGRDVQCANCGHAWYQMRSRAAVAETAAAPVATPKPASPPPSAPEPEATPEPLSTASVSDEIAKAAEPVEEKIAEPPIAADAVASEPLAEREPEIVEEVSVVEAGMETGVAEDFAEADAAEVAAATANDVTDTLSGEADPTNDEAEEIAAVTAVDAVPAVEAAVAESVAAEEVAQAELSQAEMAGADAAGVAPAAYAVDESVLAILREEAEREALARRSEAAKPLETQTDLGIDTAIRTKAEENVTLAAVDATRRTRLPDVEEINSTLRPADTVTEEGAVVESAPAEGRSSFRSGFLLVLTVAILGSALYGSADALAEAVPALAGPLKAYVGFVDSLRLQLDGLMQSATVAINGN